MSDFVSDFWHYYVLGLVVLSLAFCVWILASNMTKRKPGPVDLHHHIWDEDLQEYNNPLPRWWMYMFWGALVFAVCYLFLYPGLGNLPGKIGWTAVAQYKEEMKKADEQFNPIYDKYLKQDLLAVSANPEAQAMGQRLFLTYCAQCHGADAHGAKGFPNLTDNDWLYGGAACDHQDHHHGWAPGRHACLGAGVGGGWREGRSQLCAFLVGPGQ